MLMASALYMGEGAKSEKHFSLGNSDPRIIQVWLAILRGTLGIVESKLRCQLAITDGKGVCVVYYHSLEVRRFLDAIGRGVVDKLLSR